MGDDFEIEDAAIVGGFLGMVEEEEEKKRRKLEEEPLDLDDADREHDDEEDY